MVQMCPGNTCSACECNAAEGSLPGEHAPTRFGRPFGVLRCQRRDALGRGTFLQGTEMLECFQQRILEIILLLLLQSKLHSISSCYGKFGVG